MEVTIVRHAHAGNKRAWAGPDRLRPLDEVGLRDAERLAKLLDPTGRDRLISSPTLRCEQTLEPFAAMVGLPITLTPDFAPTSSWRRLAAQLDDGSLDGAVVCTHGELLRPMLRLLRLRGAPIDRGPDARTRLLTKGCAWELTISASTGDVERFRQIMPS